MVTRSRPASCRSPPPILHRVVANKAVKVTTLSSLGDLTDADMMQHIHYIVDAKKLGLTKTSLTKEIGQTVPSVRDPH